MFITKMFQRNRNYEEDFGNLINKYDNWTKELDVYGHEITNARSGAVKRNPLKRLAYKLVSTFSEGKRKEYQYGLPEVKKCQKKIDKIISKYEKTKPGFNQTYDYLNRKNVERADLNLKKEWKEHYEYDLKDLTKIKTKEPKTISDIINGSLDWDQGKDSVKRSKEQIALLEKTRPSYYTHLDHIVKEDAKYKNEIAVLNLARSQLEAAIRTAKMSYIINY